MNPHPNGNAKRLRASGVASSSDQDGIDQQDELKTVDGRPVAEAIEHAKEVAISSPPAATQHRSLKHHLLGPSLTKAGQAGVDQKKVAEIIYEASKGSKYFNNEEVKDTRLTAKIERIIKLKKSLEKLDLKRELARADRYIEELELGRDLSQYVVHIDCDAFYAAVEEIDHPELKNVPMAVGQGVLTTCNYEARRYGCRSAMAGFVAKKLCPQLVCLPLNFEKYTAKAREVRAILAQFDPRFQSSSIDEAYLNITQYCSDHTISPEEAVRQLRDEVKDRCLITISAGIAPNAKIAKICSNKNKPNGQFHVPNDRIAVMAFMRDLSTRKVNGVGRVLERELDAIGIKTCGELYDHRAFLSRLFGEKTMEFLLQTYLGLGRTDIAPAEESERKSVGTESTFRDMSTLVDLTEKLRHTAESLEGDMHRVGVRGRTLVLKIKLHTYEVFTRQVTPPKAIDSADDIFTHSLPMLKQYMKEIPGMKLRLMGLRCTHLVSTKKPDLEGFFARKLIQESSHGTSNDEDGWEKWPEDEFEQTARREREEEFEEAVKLSQEHVEQDQHQDMPQTAANGVDYSTSEWHEPFGHYKYGSETGTPTKPANTTGQVELELWDCPICGLGQPAEDKDFNQHIDTCLSKGAIKDTVAEISQIRMQNEPHQSRPSSAAGTKRKAGPSGAVDDSRQKKLFFI